MSETRHERAEILIAKERVEGLPPSEREWLTAHLQECSACEELARKTEQALRSLRTAAIPFPSGLASRTQFRVRLRAQELRERGPRRRMLWLACAASWIFGIASAPYVWRLFEWLGQQTGAPKIVWEIGFGLWWAVPVAVAAIVMLLENTKRAEEIDWSAQEK